jgi:fructokinase
MSAINQPVQHRSEKSEKSEESERQRRIMIVGEALLDHFPDVAIPGGSPFNVARHLAALGAELVMVTRVGMDTDADIILNEFARFGMSSVGVQRDAQRPTGVVKVTLSEHGHQFHIGENQAWDAIESASALAITEQVNPHIICINTLAQRNAISKQAIAAMLDNSDALRVLDLNLRDGADNRELASWSLRHVDVLKVNDDELSQLLHWFVDVDSSTTKDIVADVAADVVANTSPAYPSKALLEAILQLLRLYPLKRLLVTRGADGYVVFDSLGHIVAQGETPVVEVVDTVGAGDAFLAITLLGESLGWSVDLTSSRAAQFAAAVCTHRGAVTNDLAFYEIWREQWHLPCATQAYFARELSSHITAPMTKPLKNL